MVQVDKGTPVEVVFGIAPNIFVAAEVAALQPQVVQ
jgi:hypothetical protein